MACRFMGCITRIAELIEHHAQRCDGDRRWHASASRFLLPELVPVVFHRALDEHQTGFAFGEVLAHVNHMLTQRRLALSVGADGIERYRST